jgi:calmodulin
LRRSSVVREKKWKSKFSKAQLERYKEEFDLFDHDESGHLNKKELLECLQSLGQNPTEAEMNALFKEVAA